MQLLQCEGGYVSKLASIKPEIMKKPILTIVVTLLTTFISIGQEVLDLSGNPQNCSAIDYFINSYPNLKSGANPPSVINVIPSPNHSTYIGDIAFDGKYLWVEGYNEYFLHQISPVDGAIIKSIPTTVQRPHGLTFDGNYLWLADADNKIIQKIDTLDGTVVLSFPTPADPNNSNPQGLAWDGNNLWHNDSKFSGSSGQIDSLFQIDPTGNIINSFHHFSDGPSGLAFDGTYLWSSDNFTTKIYKIDPNTILPIDSIDAPGGDFPNGLAFDGQYLWVANNDSDMLYQIDIGFVPTGVSDLYQTQKGLTIYPNPASNQLTIGSELLPINKIEIIGLTGKVIKSFQPNTRTINISDLPDGIYFLQAVIDDRRINAKFIKQ